MFHLVAVLVLFLLPERTTSAAAIGLRASLACMSLAGAETTGIKRVRDGRQRGCGRLGQMKCHRAAGCRHAGKIKALVQLGLAALQGRQGLRLGGGDFDMGQARCRAFDPDLDSAEFARLQMQGDLRIAVGGFGNIHHRGGDLLHRCCRTGSELTNWYDGLCSLGSRRQCQGARDPLGRLQQRAICHCVGWIVRLCLVLGMF